MLAQLVDDINKGHLLRNNINHAKEYCVQLEENHKLVKLGYGILNFTHGWWVKPIVGIASPIADKLMDSFDSNLTYGYKTAINQYQTVEKKVENVYEKVVTPTKKYLKTQVSDIHGKIAKHLDKDKDGKISFLDLKTSTSEIIEKIPVVRSVLPVLLSPVNQTFFIIDNLWEHYKKLKKEKKLSLEYFISSFCQRFHVCGKDFKSVLTSVFEKFESMNPLKSFFEYTTFMNYLNPFCQKQLMVLYKKFVPIPIQELIDLSYKVYNQEPNQTQGKFIQAMKKQLGSKYDSKVGEFLKFFFIQAQNVKKVGGTEQQSIEMSHYFNSRLIFYIFYSFCHQNVSNYYDSCLKSTYIYIDKKLTDNDYENGWENPPPPHEITLRVLMLMIMNRSSTKINEYYSWLKTNSKDYLGVYLPFDPLQSVENSVVASYSFILSILLYMQTQSQHHYAYLMESLQPQFEKAQKDMNIIIEKINKYSKNCDCSCCHLDIICHTYYNSMSYLFDLVVQKIFQSKIDLTRFLFLLGAIHLIPYEYFVSYCGDCCQTCCHDKEKKE